MKTDLESRFTAADVEHFERTMTIHREREQSRMAFAYGVDYDAEGYLKALPTALFLDVLEDAVNLTGYDRWPSVEEINRLFAKRGIYYRFTGGGQAEWTGDPGAYSGVVRPALDALSDQRLQGARSEFETALGHLRAGTPKDEEDAIEEAGKAVESVMKVLLDEHGVTRTGKETAFPLFDMLSGNGIVVSEADNAVRATARLRNAYGGHGAGAMPRVIPAGVATLALQSAAAAIVYLAGHLP